MSYNHPVLQNEVFQSMVQGLLALPVTVATRVGNAIGLDKDNNLCCWGITPEDKEAMEDQWSGIRFIQQGRPPNTYSRAFPEGRLGILIWDPHWQHPLRRLVMFGEEGAGMTEIVRLSGALLDFDTSYMSINPSRLDQFLTTLESANIPGNHKALAYDF